MLLRTTLIALGALTVIACDNDKKTEMVTPPASSAAVGQNTVTGANVVTPLPETTPPAPMNAADVKRFDDETKMTSRTTSKLTTSTMNVRKSPGGELITTLPKDTEVTQLAKRADYYLIEFVDLSDATKHEMGWIYKDAFYKGEATAATGTGAMGGATDKLSAGSTTKPAANAKAAPLACTAPMVRAATDSEFCAKPCTTDGDCKPIGTCDGEGNVYSGPQKVGRGKYCVTGGSIGAAIGAPGMGANPPASAPMVPTPHAK